MQVSENTKALLMLSSPLYVGKKQDNSVQPLSPKTLRQLLHTLQSMGACPADLTTSRADELLQPLQDTRAINTIKRLLSRGFQLGNALSYWAKLQIWVLGLFDEAYPMKWKNNLGEHAPAVVFGCGDPRLAENVGLGIVGSRNIDEKLEDFTRQNAILGARAGITIVSGGARGVDKIAMGAALDEGGSVVGVLADSLEKAVLARDARRAILDNRLLLLSTFDPSAGFHVGNAMQRNKYIYALSAAVLIINADYEKGGTWSGATEHLEKFKTATLFVRNDPSNKALKELLDRGAKPWPSPQGPDALRAIIEQCDLSTKKLERGDLSQKILHLLENGPLSLKNLATLTGVSESIVRSTCETLASMGKVRQAEPGKVQLVKEPQLF